MILSINKRIMIIGICVTSAFCLSVLAFNAHFSFQNPKTEPLNSSLSESYIDEQEFSSQSDAIVIAKLSSKPFHGYKSIRQNKETNEIVSVDLTKTMPKEDKSKPSKLTGVSVPVFVYEFEMLESIKAPSSFPKKFELTVLEGLESKYCDFSDGGEYLLYLKENSLGQRSEFVLTSYSQGLFSIDKITGKLTNKKNTQSLTLTEVREKTKQ